MKRYTLQLVIVIMFIGSTESRLFGQEEIRVESRIDYKSLGTVSSALDTISDSVGFRYQKYAARYTWERAISLPLEILFLPVELFFRGTKATIEFVDDSKLIPRVKYLLTCDDGSCGVIPTYSSISGAGINVYQKGWFAPGAKFNLSLSLGLERTQNYQLRFRNNRLFNKAISSDYLIRYRLLSEDYFFLDKKFNFAHEQTTALVTYGKRIGDRNDLKVIFGYNVNNILEGRGMESPPISECNCNKDLLGLGENVKLIRLGLAGIHDSKNRPGNPSRGIEVQATTSIYSQVSDDKFGFWKSSFEIKHFTNLYYDRVLMLRIAGEITEPISSKEIPFYYLSELGRTGTIRGFERGRFRDRDMILGSLEYRYPVWIHGIDALFFIDAGKVSPNIFDDNSGNEFNVSYGTGFRIWTKEGLVSKLEIGWSDDGMRITFGLN